jgi:hypothetical protein
MSFINGLKLVHAIDSLGHDIIFPGPGGQAVFGLSQVH